MSLDARAILDELRALDARLERLQDDTETGGHPRDQAGRDAFANEAFGIEQAREAIGELIERLQRQLRA